MVKSNNSKAITWAVVTGVVIITVIVIVVITHHYLKGINDKNRREERERFRIEAQKIIQQELVTSSAEEPIPLISPEKPVAITADIPANKTLPPGSKKVVQVDTTTVTSQQVPEVKKRRQDFKKRGVKSFTDIETKKTFGAVEKNMGLEDVLNQEQLNQLKSEKPSNMNDLVDRLKDYLTVSDIVPTEREEMFDHSGIDQYGSFHNANYLQTLWPGNRTISGSFSLFPKGITRNIIVVSAGRVFPETEDSDRMDTGPIIEEIIESPTHNQEENLIENGHASPELMLTSD